MCTGLNIDIWAYFLPYFRLTEHFFQNQALTSCWGSSKDEVPDVGQLAGYGRMCIPNTEGSINIVVTIVYREISPVVCGFSMPGYIHEHAHAHTHNYIHRYKQSNYIHTYIYIYIYIPAEALPACENDQNYYFLTARSQFLHSKPIEKKGPSTLGMTTLPSLQPQKGKPQLFLTLKIIERSIKIMWKCQ